MNLLAGSTIVLAAFTFGCVGADIRNPMGRKMGPSNEDAILANMTSLAEDSDFNSLKDGHLILNCAGKQIGKPVKIEIANFQKNPLVKFKDVSSIKEGDLCSIGLRSTGFKMLANSLQKVYFNGNWGSEDSQISKDLGKLHFLSNSAPLTKKDNSFELNVRLYRSYLVSSGTVISTKISYQNAQNKLQSNSEISAFLVCNAIGVVPAKNFEVKLVSLSHLIDDTGIINLNFEYKEKAAKLSCSVSLTEHRGDKIYDWFTAETLDLQTPSTADEVKKITVNYTLSEGMVRAN